MWIEKSPSGGEIENVMMKKISNKNTTSISGVVDPENVPLAGCSLTRIRISWFSRWETVWVAALNVEGNGWP